tara:strand:- start:869 stop:1135 length:267 start_codon:yes stop_codon:yes gene_type:complete
MLPADSQVNVVHDVVARDHYQGLLAYLFTAADNLFPYETLIARGHEQVLETKPNTACLSEMRAGTAFAHRSNLELWRACETSRGYIQR